MLKLALSETVLIKPFCHVSKVAYVGYKEESPVLTVYLLSELIYLREVKDTMPSDGPVV